MTSSVAEIYRHIRRHTCQHSAGTHIPTMATCMTSALVLQAASHTACSLYCPATVARGTQPTWQICCFHSVYEALIHFLCLQDKADDKINTLTTRHSMYTPEAADLTAAPQCCCECPLHTAGKVMAHTIRTCMITGGCLYACNSRYSSTHAYNSQCTQEPVVARSANSLYLVPSPYCSLVWASSTYHIV